MPKKFSEFIIESNPFLPDAISGLLWKLNISGIEEGESNLKNFAEVNVHLTKRQISDKILVKQSIQEYKTREDQTVITIDPKMSFGTGKHKKTKLILLNLEKYFKRNETILDVGSGTGILGIAAEIKNRLMKKEKSY